MAVDLSGYTDYYCRDCRDRCLRPADSEEAFRGLCVDCNRLDRLHDLSEVDLLDDLDLSWFLAQLDEDWEGGPGMRPPSHGGSTRKPTDLRRATGPRTRDCGSSNRAGTQSDLADFLPEGVNAD